MPESLQTPTNHKEIIALIKRISGQANFIGTPRIYVDMLDGDLVAAVWLNQVVYWDGKTSEPLGFYKVAPEWESELGLSPFQVRRVSKKCQRIGIVNIEKRKVYGVPKLHYLIVWPEFLALLNRTINKLNNQKEEADKAPIVNKLDNQEGKESESEDPLHSIDYEDSSDSLTENQTPSENEEEEEIILPLIDRDPRLLLGKLEILFPEATFGKLALRKEYLQKSGAFVLGYIAKAYLEQKGLRSPLGLIASRLKNNEAPDLYYLENFRDILPDEYLEAIGLGEFKCNECGTIFDKLADRASHWEAEHNREEAAPIAPPSPEGPILSRAWDYVLDQLSRDMPRGTFETWVGDTKAIDIVEGNLRVWTPSPSAREWLESRLSSTVSRLLIGILNRSDLGVSFVTWGSS